MDFHVLTLCFLSQAIADAVPVPMAFRAGICVSGAVLKVLMTPFPGARSIPGGAEVSTGTREAEHGLCNLAGKISREHVGYRLWNYVYTSECRYHEEIQLGVYRRV